MAQTNMEETNNPLLVLILFVSTSIGVVSLQDIDIILAIVLKSISILSFLVATGYALWKWRSEYKNKK